MLKTKRYRTFKKADDKFQGTDFNGLNLLFWLNKKCGYLWIAWPNIGSSATNYEYYTSGLFEEEIMLTKMASRMDESHVVTRSEKRKTNQSRSRTRRKKWPTTHNYPGRESFSRRLSRRCYLPKEKWNARFYALRQRFSTSTPLVKRHYPPVIVSR